MASGSVEFLNENDKKRTKETFKTLNDPRSTKKAGQKSEQIITHTRSGHTIAYDDSPGAESITIQHRGGTAVQMMPDGALQITAHNSRYDVTFGDNRVTISGANDITVKGDASFRVYGDYNMTCHKDYNLTVMGDLNVTAKNKNQMIRGNKDTIMKNENKKIEGSSSVAAGGAISRVASGSITTASISGKAVVAGSAGVHVAVPGDQGDITMKVKQQGNIHMETKNGKFDAKFSNGSDEVSLLAEDGKFHAQSDNEFNMESKQEKIQMKAQKDVGIKSTTAGVNVDAPSGNFQAMAGQKVRMTAGADMQMKSAGTAGFEGAAATHVGGSAGVTHVVGGGAGVNIDPLSGLLNLAGGGGIPMPNMTQLSFNFGNIMGATGIDKTQTEAATKPTEEPDLSSWTDSLL